MGRSLTAAAPPESKPAPRPDLAHEAAGLLADPAAFTARLLAPRLYGYQLAPLRAVVESVVGGCGREFLVVFPRQSGKNEAVAQLLVYLLNLLRGQGGPIVMGATGDALGMAVDRLEQRLDNPWNRGRWTKRRRPTRRCLGGASVLFLSTHPAARARGQTARWLLVVDETQDQPGPHIEAVFTPMRAAHNATALYIGTVKSTSDFLWAKKRQLEAEQARDGARRVFFTGPESVTAENPAYQAFLDAQVARHGRHHPIVASEYYLEPIDGTGGLFDARRRRLMRGTHGRQTAPACTSTAGSAGTGDRSESRDQGESRAQPRGAQRAGRQTAPGPERSRRACPERSRRVYVATLDVAGQDEAATDPLAQLDNPGRDYTAATMFEVRFPLSPLPHTPWQADALPVYRAVDLFLDQGTRHFEDAPGRPALVHQLLAWLTLWQPAHLLADESGVGQGLVSWLRAALGPHRVTGYSFAGRSQKAVLGSAFLALVETGRFQYWTDHPQPQKPEILKDFGLLDLQEGGPPLSEAWWFFRQAAACTYDLPPDGRFERDLRWGVAAGHRTDTPLGPRPTHDDRLLSAALVAELDRRVRAGKISLGVARAERVPGRDPLGGSIY